MLLLKNMLYIFIFNITPTPKIKKKFKSVIIVRPAKKTLLNINNFYCVRVISSNPILQDLMLGVVWLRPTLQYTFIELIFVLFFFWQSVNFITNICHANNATINVYKMIIIGWPFCFTRLLLFSLWFKVLIKYCFRWTREREWLAWVIF